MAKPACLPKSLFPVGTGSRKERLLTGEKEKKDMWYVMQVASGREGHTVMMMERMISGGVLDKCFVPTRRMKKKYQGNWREVVEKLFPGYVFLVTGNPQSLYDELKQIPALTKLLGSCEECFTPLSEPDVQLLLKLQDIQNDRAEAGLSGVSVGEGREVRILYGPLKNLEGQIHKVNLHKRIAVVEAKFMGTRSFIHLGIEIVGKD